MLCACHFFVVLILEDYDNGENERDAFSKHPMKSNPSNLKCSEKYDKDWTQKYFNILAITKSLIHLNLSNTLY